MEYDQFRKRIRIFFRKVYRVKLGSGRAKKFVKDETVQRKRIKDPQPAV